MHNAGRPTTCNCRDSPGSICKSQDLCQSYWDTGAADSALHTRQSSGTSPGHPSPACTHLYVHSHALPKVCLMPRVFQQQQHPLSPSPPRHGLSFLPLQQEHRAALMASPSGHCGTSSRRCQHLTEVPGNLWVGPQKPGAFEEAPSWLPVPASRGLHWGTAFWDQQDCCK